MTTTYRRDTLELELDRIQGGGFWKRKSADRLVTVSLVWPRPLVASRVSANPFHFEQDGLHLADRDWSERILFKENVEGPFGVVVQVSEPLSIQEIKRTLAALGAAVLKATGSEAAQLATGSWLTTLAKFPFSHFAGELSGIGKTPHVVAAGRITLRPGTPGPIDIPLTVPEDILLMQRIRTGGKIRTRRKRIHQRGDSAGTVRLKATYYRA